MRLIITRAGLTVLGAATFLLAASVWGQSQLLNAFRIELLWFGILGSALIALSYIYLIRKRVKLWGKMINWLRFHEATAVLGTVIILVHTGTRVHNLTGWLAIILLLVLCVSGIVGRYLYTEVNREIVHRKRKGFHKDDLISLQVWRLRFDGWRKVHMPLTWSFIGSVMLHLIATAFYGGWKF